MVNFDGSRGGNKNQKYSRDTSNSVQLAQEYDRFSPNSGRARVLKSYQVRYIFGRLSLGQTFPNSLCSVWSTFSFGNKSSAEKPSDPCTDPRYLQRICNAPNLIRDGIKAARHVTPDVRATTRRDREKNDEKKIKRHVPNKQTKWKPRLGVDGREGMSSSSTPKWSICNEVARG